MYLSMQMRFDITYAVQRLAEYSAKPMLIAFEGVIHILHYLAGDMLRPLTYPKQSISETNTIRWFSSPEMEQSLEVPNYPTLFFSMVEMVKGTMDLPHPVGCTIKIG